MSSDGSNGADGADGAGRGGAGGAQDASTQDAVSSAMDAVGAALGGFAEAVAGAVSDLSSLTSAVQDALGQLAGALGLNLDEQDLQGIAGAALAGFVFGGVPGAVAGAVKALAGSVLSDVAREAIASSGLSPQAQSLANQAVDMFAGQILGAQTSPQAMLASMAVGAISGGRIPDVGDLGAVARSLDDVRGIAADVIGAAVTGDMQALDARVSGLQNTLESRFGQVRDIAAGVADLVESGRQAYASGHYDRFGNAVEQLGVDVARLMVENAI